MERLGCPLVLLVVFFGLVQFALGYQGIEYELGTGWAIIAIAAALIFKFTLPITIGTYFGVVDVHGGPWWAGLLVAAPGLLVAVPFMATTVLAFILDSGKKVWASTEEQPQDITPLRPSVTRATQNNTASTSAYTPSQSDTPSQSAPYRPTDTRPSVIHVAPTYTPNTNAPTANTPMPSTAAYTPSPIDPYQQAGQELLSGNLDPAIWARSLVEGAGNDGAVKAAYVKLRVAQLNAAIQAEAVRIKAEEEKRLAKAEEEKQRVEAAAGRLNALTTHEYAALMNVTLDQAEKMQPWRIYRLGGRYAISYDGLAYKYDKLEDAIAHAKRLEGRFTHADAARTEAEAARVKAVEDNRDPLVTAYAQQHGLSYEDAAFFLPYGISKFGSKFLVNNHSFDKLEDAIHHVRKAKLPGSEAATAHVVREKSEEEKRQAEAGAARERAEADNREVATTIAAQAKVAEEKRRADIEALHAKVKAAGAKILEENRRAESEAARDKGDV
jgi:hypothetical protein